MLETKSSLSQPSTAAKQNNTAFLSVHFRVKMSPLCAIELFRYKMLGYPIAGTLNATSDSWSQKLAALLPIRKNGQSSLNQPPTTVRVFLWFYCLTEYVCLFWNLFGFQFSRSGRRTSRVCLPQFDEFLTCSCLNVPSSFDFTIQRSPQVLQVLFLYQDVNNWFGMMVKAWAAHQRPAWLRNTSASPLEKRMWLSRARYLRSEE